MIVSNIYHHHNSYEFDVIYIFMTKKNSYYFNFSNQNS